jgi:hypothetical protein
MQIPQAIKRIEKEYYEQPYSNKFNNSDEVEKFLERHNFPMHIQYVKISLN